MFHADPDDEVLFTPPAKKKPRRSRAVREKAAPSAKPRAEKENFRFATGSGRGTSGKRHTVCYGCDMTFEKSTVRLSLSHATCPGITLPKMPCCGTPPPLDIRASWVDVIFNCMII